MTFFQRASWWCAAFVALGLPLSAQTATTSADDLLTTITAFVEEENLGPQAAFALVVADLRSGTFLLDQNASQSMTLGRLTKLYTAAAGLERLGPDFRFTTTLALNGELLEDGTLEGSVLLLGGGDPVLGSAYFPEQPLGFPLNSFASELRRRGIKTITGDVVAVEGRYAGDVHSLSWSNAASGAVHQVEVDALSYQGGEMRVTVDPGMDVGKRPRVTLHPELEGILLQVQARVGEPGSTDSLIVERQDEGKVIMVRGNIPAGSRPKVVGIPLVAAPFTAAVQFASELDQAGITVEGGPVAIDEFPGGAPNEELVTHQSPRLAELLPELFSPKNHLIAEVVGRELAHAEGKEPSFFGACAVLTDEVEQWGLKGSGFKLVDCSGVSEYNKGSADALARLIIQQRGPGLNQRLWMNSLPRATPAYQDFTGVDLGEWERAFGKYGDRLRFVLDSRENYAAFAGVLTTHTQKELVVVMLFEKAKFPAVTLERVLERIDRAYLPE